MGVRAEMREGERVDEGGGRGDGCDGDDGDEVLKERRSPRERGRMGTSHGDGDDETMNESSSGAGRRMYECRFIREIATPRRDDEARRRARRGDRSRRERTVDAHFHHDRRARSRTAARRASGRETDTAVATRPDSARKEYSSGILSVGTPST
jgi:hypothetical protein